MESLLLDIPLPADFHDVPAAIGGPQNTGPVLGRTPFASYGPAPFQVTQTNPSPGSVSGGHLTTPTLNGSRTFTGAFDGSGPPILDANSNNNLKIVLTGSSLLPNNPSNGFGSLTVNAPSILDFGAGASIASFMPVLANVTLSVNSRVSTVDDFSSRANADRIGNAPLISIVFAGRRTMWQPFDRPPASDNQIVPVPEPEVYGAAFVFGLLALAAWRRPSAAPRFCVASACTGRLSDCKPFRPARRWPMSNSTDAPWQERFGFTTCAASAIAKKIPARAHGVAVISETTATGEKAWLVIESRSNPLRAQCLKRLETAKLPPLASLTVSFLAAPLADKTPETLASVCRDQVILASQLRRELRPAMR